MAGSTGPVETKVVAGTVGAGAGAVTAEFVLWLLDTTLMTPDTTGDIPTPVTMFVTMVVASAFAYAAAYTAKHTARPDLGQR